MNLRGVSVNRREMICSTTALGGMTFLAGKQAVLADENQIPMTLPESIIDTNLSLFQWPFRNLPLNDTGKDTVKIVKKLKELKIKQAWAGSYEGILHRNLDSVNRRLTSECNTFSELIPIGTINPSLPGWDTDFLRCCDQYQMPGIRLYPNYHQYDLSHSNLTELLSLAYQGNKFIQIVTAAEDSRTQHELVNVPDVDLSPLIDILKRPRMPVVQLLNARLRIPIMQKLGNFENLYFDTSRVDGTDGLKILFDDIPSEKVCFGTHSPFLIPEAALIRLIESPISDKQRLNLCFKSSQRILEGRGQ